MRFEAMAFRVAMLATLLMILEACTGGGIAPPSSRLRDSTGAKNSGDSDGDDLEFDDETQGSSKKFQDDEDDLDIDSKSDSSKKDEDAEDDEEDDEEGEDGEGEDGDGEFDGERHDLVVEQTAEDEDFEFTVRLKVDGKTVDEAVAKSPGDDKQVVLKELCLTGADTVLTVEVAGLSTSTQHECMHITKVDETSVRLDFDTTKAGGANCGKDGRDETLVFKCAESKSLEIE